MHLNETCDSFAHLYHRSGAGNTRYHFDHWMAVWIYCSLFDVLPASHTCDKEAAEMFDNELVFDKKCWCLLLYEWTYSLPSDRKVQCTTVSFVFCLHVKVSFRWYLCSMSVISRVFAIYSIHTSTSCSSFLDGSCQTLAQNNLSPKPGGHPHPEPLQRCSSTRDVHRFIGFPKIAAIWLADFLADFVKTNRTESWNKPSDRGSETAGECADGNGSSAQSSGGFEGWADFSVEMLLQKCD